MHPIWHPLLYQWANYSVWCPTQTTAWISTWDTYSCSWIHSRPFTGSSFELQKLPSINNRLQLRASHSSTPTLCRTGSSMTGWKTSNHRILRKLSTAYILSSKPLKPCGVWFWIIDSKWICPLPISQQRLQACRLQAGAFIEYNTCHIFAFHGDWDQELRMLFVSVEIAQHIRT